MPLCAIGIESGPPFARTSGWSSVAEASGLGLLAGFDFHWQRTDVTDVGYRKSASERPTTEDDAAAKLFHALGHEHKSATVRFECSIKSQ